MRPGMHLAERHGRIVDALRAKGPSTAQELTRLLGGRPVAMRAHLRNLHAAGLVTYIEEHQTLGRPVRRFQLTPAADTLFTKHYDLLSVRLAEAIVRQFGEAALERILQSWQDDLTPYLRRRLPRETRRRIAALAEYQSQFGFMASVERDRESLSLVERNCPIARFAAAFPKICHYEAGLFHRVLGRSVKLALCQAKGDGKCVFQIGRPK